MRPAKAAKGALPRVCEDRVSDQPDGHEIAGVEGEVQKRREVFEELQRQVLGLVEDPHRQ
jgi:hypothetical protein